MGHDGQKCSTVIARGILIHSFNANAMLSKNRCNRSQHARQVIDLQGDLEAAGGAVASGPDTIQRPVGRFEPAAPRAKLVTAQQLFDRLGHADQAVLDARATPRFRGEVEPLDPVAGHIPGALNRPFTENLQADGRFKPAGVLRAEFERLLGGRDAAQVVHQCGSGVSAVPNLLAMELAGLGRAALYPGSWSAWCNTEGTPRARG